jgi:hypothetical protein
MNMNKVTIFQFEVYDTQNDMMKKSCRWGTREAIKDICGKVLEDTATEFEGKTIDSDIHGLTARDFNPNPRDGFQKKVGTCY